MNIILYQIEFKIPTILTLHLSGKYPSDEKSHKEILKTVFGSPIVYGTIIGDYVIAFRNNGIR